MENLTFKLGPCQESEDKYLDHKVEKERIAKKFSKSKDSFVYPSTENIPSPDFERVYNSEKTQGIPYGAYTTLGKSGCAIFVLHQVLRLKCGITIDIRELAELVAEQGYYYPGRGTYHCLFDHAGSKEENTDAPGKCHRATSVNELLNYLAKSETPVATLLVKNSVFYGRDTGKHFVNCTGITNLGILVNDPEASSTLTVSAEKLVAATEVAWLWD